MNLIGCPICKSYSTKISYLARDKKMVDANKKLKASGSATKGRDIYLCMECQVFFCHPLPSQTELLLEYDASDDENFVSQNQYRYKTFYYHFNKMIRELSLNIENISVTDIGAASGVFIKVVNDLGIEGKGYEANNWLVNYGRERYKVDLHKGSIRDFIPSKNKVDLVTFWDVIEHLSEPHDDLEFLSSKLKSKSIVIISLPSTDSKSFKLLKWHWPMHLNVHLFYFNKNSLNCLLSSCGFKMILSSRYGQKLSLGYLIYRFIKILLPTIEDNSLKFLTNGFLNRVSIKYSIGQRIYVFEKT